MHGRSLSTCLNPFEFRAGIYLGEASNGCSRQEGLNPFEFRAGIYFLCGWQNCSLIGVLIPLNSGLVFTFAPVVLPVVLPLS